MGLRQKMSFVKNINLVSLHNLLQPIRRRGRQGKRISATLHIYKDIHVAVSNATFDAMTTKNKFEL